MKTAILTIGVVLYSFISTAEASEPCKGLIMPDEVSKSKVIFVLPTYDEYVHSVVIKSLSSGTFTSEENILNEATYAKVRDHKIEDIKQYFNNSYEIMTKKGLESEGLTEGYVLYEELFAPLVTETNQNFEQYTLFSIADLKSDEDYTLVDPSKEEGQNCIFKPGKYKYKDLLALIQR